MRSDQGRRIPKQVMKEIFDFSRFCLIKNEVRTSALAMHKIPANQQTAAQKAYSAQMTYCSLISKKIENECDIKQNIGSYVGPDLMDPTSGFFHAWNVCEDGTIVDASYVQFLNETNDVRIVKKSDKEYQYYQKNEKCKT